MKLTYHDRYDYSPITERPDYSWPDGKRLAVHIALNIEHFAFDGTMGHTPTELGPPPDPRNYAWREYGLRVGIWRIFDLLDELKLPACHLTNSTIYDFAPQIMDRARARGDEVVGHGRTNSERQGDLAEEAEAALIREATEYIEKHEGARPKGWMSPWISESAVTPDLLKENGYTYLMNWPADDQPFWMRTRAGPILQVPYHIEINDSPANLSRRHTPGEFADMAMDHFDEMLGLSVDHPLVLGMPLHTFIMGQPFRLKHLRRILGHFANHPERDSIWFTRPADIADHVSRLPKGTLPGDGG
ncbi:MAG: polysaccharide deacetylase family protein [Rhodospirillales bacterium]|nr:polysaccharide deacetylase family protein [Rhodospirillales bacterium]